MIETIRWEGTKRKDMTKGEMNAMRTSGMTPAIITLKGENSVPVFLNTMDIEKRPFGNFRIELKIKGIKEPFDCFLKTIQYNHDSTRIVHADLQGLVVGQELDLDVMIELIGEAPGVKQGGILNTGLTSVKIRTLPRNIPGSIQVDISELNIGDSIGVQDIKFSEDHTLIEPLEGGVVSCSEPKVEAEVDPDAEMAMPEIITEKKVEEEA